MIHPFFLAIASGICVLLVVCLVSFYVDVKKRYAKKRTEVKMKIIKDEQDPSPLALNRRSVFETETEFDGLNSGNLPETRTPAI